MIPIKNRTLLLFLALAANLAILAQLGIMIVQGEEFCLNQGCEVVHSLIKISSFSFNLIGLAYFQMVFWTLFLSRSHPRKTDLFLSALLLTGMGVEATLLTFQIFVANSFCSYCLVIFFFVLIMNLLGGLPQLIKSVFILGGIYIIASLLNYSSTIQDTENPAISGGTFATLQRGDSSKELYLVLSENCPHCHNVVSALTQAGNSCTFHFNPIDPDFSLDVPGLTLSGSFDAGINRKFLKVMDFKTVPILLAKNNDGYSIIKGEKTIINYIQATCVEQSLTASPDRLPPIPDGGFPGSEFYLYPGEGECNVEVNCDPQTNR